MADDTNDSGSLEDDGSGDVPLQDLARDAGVSASLREILDGPQAPVTFPGREEIEVRLVTQESLRSAVAAARDDSLNSTVFLLAFGALIGYATNLATSTDVPFKAGQAAFLAAALSLTIAFGLLTFRSRRRLREVNQSLLSPRAPADRG